MDRVQISKDDIEEEIRIQLNQDGLENIQEIRLVRNGQISIVKQ